MTSMVDSNSFLKRSIAWSFIGIFHLLIILGLVVQTQHKSSLLSAPQYLTIINVKADDKPPAEVSVASSVPISKEKNSSRSLTPSPIRKPRQPTESHANTHVVPTGQAIDAEQNQAPHASESNTITAEAGLDLDQLKANALAMNKNYKAKGIDALHDSERRDLRMETKIAEDMKKAKRKDCLRSFGGAGLLAVIPLALSTVKDMGCNW